jgi:FkbM family methyltransferase
MELYNEVTNILKYKNISISEKVHNLINNKSIYVIGKNEESHNVSKILNINGIIDDYSESTDWKGIQIFKLSDISKDVLIINCSTSISPVSVKKYLISNGFINIVDYFELCIYNEKFVKPKFLIDTNDDFYKNYSKWLNLYNILKDDESKQVLKDVLLFRLSADPMYMQNYKVRLDEQYMEDFMQYSEEIMIDAGAFDGETTEIFCNKYKNYKEVHLFEPSEINFEKLINRLNGLDNVKFYKMGLSNQDEILSFSDALQSSSKITSDGNTQIRVVKLDDTLKTKISFIKMDIEGFELPALIGSSNHIKNNHPKLAIAVYHNSQDFWKLSEYILDIRQDYDVYIRHYTEGWSETIMYFNPKK